MKILILGAKGMLGRDLAYEFRDIKPILWDREDLDITNARELRRKIVTLKPDIIINAAAYTDVDGAESHEDLAMKVNGNAVGNLARVAARLKIVLVHYSTDHVFNGKKRGGYKETDKPKNPVNAYGASKLLGETLLLKEAATHRLMYFLIRTSWLFGPFWKQKRYEKNFVDTIMRLAKKQKELRVVNDQRGKPTLTYDLARQTRMLLTNFSPGVYHITNTTAAGGITWYQFAKKIITLTKKKTRIVPCASRAFPRPALRPRYANLFNAKVQFIRSWEEALAEYLKMKQNRPFLRRKILLGKSIDNALG